MEFPPSRNGVVEILSPENPDILVLTETGHDNMQANELNELDTRSRLTDHFKDSLAHNILSLQEPRHPG